MAAQVKLLPPLAIERLPRGETLVALERPGVPVWFGGLRCSGGTLDALDAPAGTVELVADLLNEGPAGQPPGAWRRELERAAQSLNASPHESHWTINASALQEDAGRLFGALRGWAGAPDMQNGEWGGLVKKRRAGAREGLAQPMNLLPGLARAQGLSQRHPNARVATDASYKRVPLAGTAELAKSIFRAGPGCIAWGGGGLPPEATLKLLRDFIGGLPPRTQPLPEEPAPAPARRRVWLLDHPGIDQAFIQFTRPGIRAGDPQRVALRLANKALGGGFSSRLTQRVREQLGHTYHIGSSLPEGPLANLFGIGTFTRVEHLKSMLEMIVAVCREAAERGLTEAEIGEARKAAHGSMPVSLVKPQAVLSRVVQYLSAGLAPEDIEADWRQTLDTSRDEVQAALCRMLGDRSFHLAVVAPAKQIPGGVLEAYGEVQRIAHKSEPATWGA